MMPRVDVMNGNKAAAVGAMLAGPDIIAAYPITPQTPLVEYLTRFVADGELNSVMSEVESEHTAMSILTGASLAGSRTFTATSSQGLALMYEPYFRASTLRLPIVMGIVNREMISPQTLWGSPQDSLTLRDAGWLQIYVEDNQEILDMIIQAYKVAEDNRVLLPINICYDGFYLSHMTEKVKIPAKEQVNAFLPAYKPEHIILDPERPMAVDPLTNGPLLTEYRQKHMEAQQNALGVIEEVDREYREKFGRGYGGLIEEYRCEDADALIVTMGSMTGAAKDAVDMKRSESLKIGLIKIRTVRPFPAHRLFKAIKGKKAFGVVDRNVSFGWHTGILFQETRAALYELDEKVPCAAFVGGLGGVDITAGHFCRAIDHIFRCAADNRSAGETIWLKREDG